MTVIVGTTFTLTGRFRNPDGTPFNPTTVKVACKRPSGTMVYTFGVDGTFENPVVGTFRFTGTLTEAGDWEIVMQGTGDVGAVAKKAISVMPLNVVIP